MAAPELWRHYLDFLVEADTTAEPWGRDRPRVRSLLAEMYLVGERPSFEEVGRYFADKGVEGRFRDAVLRLWKKRLDDPSQRIRYAWAYPLCMPSESRTRTDSTASARASYVNSTKRRLGTSS